MPYFYFHFGFSYLGLCFSSVDWKASLTGDFVPFMYDGSTSVLTCVGFNLASLANNDKRNLLINSTNLMHRSIPH